MKQEAGTTGSDLHERLAKLEMAEATRNLVAEYARAVDCEDVALLRSVFARDATLRYRGTVRHDGIEAIVAYYASTFERGAGPMRHFITNLRLADVTADSASSHAYFVFVSGIGSNESAIGWGCYSDRIQQSDDGVRIVEKHFDVEFAGPLQLAGRARP
jgi:ketosteroid isomerase-like protein